MGKDNNKIDKKIEDLYIHEAFEDIETEIFKQRILDKNLKANDILEIAEKIAMDYGLKGNNIDKLKEMVLIKFF